MDNSGNKPELHFENGAIVNWDDVKRWAVMNDPLFCTVVQFAILQELSELDTLRLLASTLLDGKLRLEHELKLYLANQPQPRWFVPK